MQKKCHERRQQSGSRNETSLLFVFNGMATHKRHQDERTPSLREEAGSNSAFLSLALFTNKKNQKNIKTINWSKATCC